MNETHICSRCGWNCSHDPELPTMIDGWPEDLPAPPPLPEDAKRHHKLGVCISPFEIGQKLYWDMDGADPDLPPILVMFKELTQIECANFELRDNTWIRRSEARAHIASVRALPGGVLEEHKAIFGDLLEEDFEVRVESLTAPELWPVYEVA